MHRNPWAARLRGLLKRLTFRGHAPAGAARRRAEALIARGNAAEREGRVDEACRFYRDAVAAAPSHAASHLNLGIALEALGDVSAAVDAYEAALAIDPGSAYASYNLGKARFVQGDAPRAEALLRAALAARPDFPEALVVLASILEARGDLSSAAAALESAVTLRPAYAGALRNYGMLLERLGRPREAEQVLQRAAAADPANVQAHYRLGKLLADRGAWGDAAACLARALELNPDYADAHLGMGNVFAGAGRLEEAAECFRKALALEPRMLDAQINLANVLNDLGLRHEALEHAEAALALSPNSAEARWVRLMCGVPAVRAADDELAGLRRRFAADLDELDGWFEPGRTANGHNVVGISQPFWLAYQEEDNRELLRRYGRLCARLMADWQSRQGFVPAPRRAPGPVRVGVVSQYFRNHSVWNAIVKGWFQQLDRERFALSAFCLGSPEDDETRYAKSRAAQFVQGAGGLRQWVDAILESQPDVLIYPEIGMDPMSLKLASLRLAPVQAASWGHPETTGLPTVDCYLSAEALEPAEAQKHYTERLIALPNLGCYVQPDDLQPLAADKAAWGLEPGVPLLVCPGTPFKYAPEHDWVLADIAQRLGRCRMIFFEHRTRTLSALLRERLVAAFASRGQDFARVALFLPWQSRSAFYGLLRSADVFLDTIGFSGFNTALQAVERALPIVTREGRFLRGRLASGILKRIGLPELVAADEAQYVGLAVRLAQDAGYRAEIRRRMEASRHMLYQDRAPIRALEDFLAQGL